ncbi:MAG: AgmX/PglI C-terminal domain-containing protein [Deltaproteobacteria bacterium]|nr:AgmX/PglI C-terminal domain-containing protein [Deltaproteobacteria bacterium]
MLTGPRKIIALFGVAALIVLALLLIPRRSGDRPTGEEPAAAGSSAGSGTGSHAGRDGSGETGPGGTRSTTTSARPRPGIDPRLLGKVRADPDGPARLAERLRIQSQATRVGEEGAGAEPSDTAPPARWKTSADGIKGAIQASLPEIRECYEEWLKVSPSIGGKLKVSFTIGEDKDDPDGGRVREVNLGESGIGHIAMEGCVLNVFQGLSFERPEGGQLKVTYPLIFSSDAGQ